jgi:lipopolysaccharide heptosyltransferase II
VIDWNNVRRVLVVRLRSIGDTVLATPSLIALKRFLPHAEVDVLLEDWVAPLLDGFGSVDNVLTVGRDSTSRMRTAWQLRRRHYDVAFNLHGGTTGTFFVAASGAKRRVGYTEYQYSFLYTHLLTSASEFWQKKHTHSVEQQLALLGSVGVPLNNPERTRLDVSPDAVRSLEEKFSAKPHGTRKEFALIHPAAAFDTKQWATENFARIAEFLAGKGIDIVAVAAKAERAVLDKLQSAAKVPITTFDDLSLPEITALSSKARIFVGNDSGIAHIAAAVNTPTVVVFGSSDPNHWRPWTDAPNEIVYHSMPCQPCPGYECKQFDRPHCILNVTPGSVVSALERVLSK